MKSVLAIGVFDGVHLGHQRILKKVLQRAKAAKLEPVVLTFDSAPEKVIAPDYAPAAIGTLKQKLAWIRASGIKRIKVVRFDKAFARQAPEAFVKWLLKGLQVKEVVVGSDFVFGAHAAGNTWLLSKLGAEYGFKVHVLKPRYLGGRPVSSTRIREALASGAMKQASAMLGRPFALTGKVLKGDQLGRKLGYPTANLAVEQEALPLSGVWGGRARTAPKGPWHASLANLGMRPTLKGKGKEFRVELHLLDFSGNLYGKALEAELTLFLRPEQRFKDLEALKKQIRLDESRFRRSTAFHSVKRTSGA